MLRELERKRRPRVLDLGPALGASVEFLAGYSVQLFIADLYRSLRSSTGQLPPDAVRLRRVLQEQLPVPEDGPFDLILAWDLLNYLAADQLEALGQHLGALCRPGGQLFALVSTRGPISDRPMTFEIIAPRRPALPRRRRPPSGPARATARPPSSGCWTPLRSRPPICCATACRSTSSPAA